MMPRTFVYVACAADGTIDVFSFDRANGALARLDRVEAGKPVMPLAVAPDRRHLYAVIRSEPYRVETFAIDASTGRLAHRASAPLPESMAYAATDATGRALFTASYGGNLAAVSLIDDDGIVRAAAHQTMPTGRHAHCIRVDASNRFVFVPTLGSDLVMQYRFDAGSGRLTANDPPSVAVPAGNGPRHLAFSRDGRFVYVLCELTAQVAQFALDAARGTLSLVELIESAPPEAGLVPGQAFASLAASQTAPADPRPKAWAADLALTPDGRFLYATERTTSTIALLSIDLATGRPTRVASYPTEAQPRGIRMDPRGRFLIASGEKSDHLRVFAIDPATGALTTAGRHPVGAGANWIEISEFG